MSKGLQHGCRKLVETSGVLACVAGGIVGGRAVKTYNREFTKPRRGRREERRLKNQFMFYLRVSRHSEVICFVYHCKSYRETKSGTQRSI